MIYFVNTKSSISGKHILGLCSTADKLLYPQFKLGFRKLSLNKKYEIHIMESILERRLE